MRLGVSGRLDFDFGRRFAQLVLEFIACLLEFPEALCKAAGELGKLLGAEEQQYDDKNENSLWPAGHAECEKKIH